MYALHRSTQVLMMMMVSALTFEPGSGFEQGLLQSAVQVEVEPLILCDVVSDSGQQHQVVEALGHPLLQVRGEDPATHTHTHR